MPSKVYKAWPYMEKSTKEFVRTRAHKRWNRQNIEETIRDSKNLFLENKLTGHLKPILINSDTIKQTEVILESLNSIHDLTFIVPQNTNQT